MSCISKQIVQDALIERITRLNAEGEKAKPIQDELIRFKKFIDGLTPINEGGEK